MSDKRCRQCDAVKPITDFRVNRRENGHTYYQCLCRDCHNANTREWRKKMRLTSPEWAAKERQYTRERREADPEKYRQYGRDHYQRRKLERMRAVMQKATGQS